MLSSRQKILISSSQYPYYGGAATNAYTLIKHFRSEGYNTAGVFTGGGAGIDCDPEKLGGVFHARMGTSSKEIRRNIIEYLGALPDFVFAKNYTAPVFCLQLFPEVRVNYLVSGSPLLTKLARQGVSAQYYLNQPEASTVRVTEEQQCISAVSRVIPNSYLGGQILRTQYPNASHITDAVDTSSAHLSHTIRVSSPWVQRKTDIAFICSRFDRDIKNSSFARKLMACPRFSSLQKLAVGEGSEAFSGMNNMTVLPMLAQTVLLEKLQDVKVLICTSYFDSSPNIVREALVSGCNVLISKNCGWSEYFSSEAVCRDVYEQSEWEEKIIQLLKGARPDLATFPSMQTSIAEQLISVAI